MERGELHEHATGNLTLLALESSPGCCDNPDVTVLSADELRHAIKEPL